MKKKTRRKNAVETQSEKLRAEADDLPHGPAKVALLQESVRQADPLSDFGGALDARGALMEAALFSGRPDLLLDAFEWCAVKFDQHPERFDATAFHWKQKWVLGCAIQFPEIGREPLEELLADMERRFRAFGSTMHALAAAERDFAVHCGDITRAKAAHAALEKLCRDDLSDCYACLAAKSGEYYALLRQWRDAIEKQMPVLDGRLTCEQQPHVSFAGALRPLFQLGRTAEADTYQRQGYRLIQRRGELFVRQLACHLQFLVLIGDQPRAQAVLERHLPTAVDSYSPLERFEFFAAARLWSARLAALGTTAIKLRISPPGLPPEPNGTTEVAALETWFAAQCEELAHRFDERNGTDAFRRNLAELPDLLRAAAAFAV